MNFEIIAKMTQTELKTAAARELEQLGYSTETADGYVYAKGEIPVLLVAHLDTVHRERVKEIFYSKDGNLLLSPEGIGGDDRCGVYIIFQVIQQHRCHVLFCEDEEIGAIGARAFAKGNITPDVNYIIEVDRRGSDDAVFYDCDNPDFTDFICGFGFNEKKGSFSDISVIAPSLGIAAVNLSAGYHNEHTRSEYVDLAEMASIIDRICQIVETPTEAFEYIERARTFIYGEYGQQMLDLWGHMSESQHEKREMLMQLPDSAHLVIDGHSIKNHGGFFIDSGKNVYDYIDCLGAAVKSENTVAHSKSGISIQFSKRDAVRKKVIRAETALEMLGYVS